MCPEATSLAILQQKLLKSSSNEQNFQLNKIPFGQMNVINNKMEMYLFLFVPSICKRTRYWPMIDLSFSNAFFFFAF